MLPLGRSWPAGAVADGGSLNLASLPTTGTDRRPRGHGDSIERGRARAAVRHAGAGRWGSADRRHPASAGIECWLSATVQRGTPRPARAGRFAIGRHQDAGNSAGADDHARCVPFGRWRGEVAPAPSARSRSGEPEERAGSLAGLRSSGSASARSTALSSSRPVAGRPPSRWPASQSSAWRRWRRVYDVPRGHGAGRDRPAVGIVAVGPQAFPLRRRRLSWADADIVPTWPTALFTYARWPTRSRALTNCGGATAPPNRSGWVRCRATPWGSASARSTALRRAASDAAGAIGWWRRRFALGVIRRSWAGYR